MTTTSASVSSLIQSIGEIPPESIVFGRSEAMQAVRSRMDKVAAANVPVLIQGESGTGKDIIARLIHGRSPWRTGPYVKVNCPAIPGTLLESELFGYEKGAFTGPVGVGVGFTLLGNNSMFAQSEGLEEGSGSLTQGDAALLRFAAAAEILESDFWVQDP